MARGTAAALLTLALWSLARPLIASARLRAATAFIAAQPALLYGYYLWGGIKEIAAAALVASVAGLLGASARRRFAYRATPGCFTAAYRTGCCDRQAMLK